MWLWRSIFCCLIVYISTCPQQVLPVQMTPIMNSTDSVHIWKSNWLMSVNKSVIRSQCCIVCTQMFRTCAWTVSSHGVRLYRACVGSLINLHASPDWNQKDYVKESTACVVDDYVFMCQQCYRRWERPRPPGVWSRRQDNAPTHPLQHPADARQLWVPTAWRGQLRMSMSKLFFAGGAEAVTSGIGQ